MALVRWAPNRELYPVNSQIDRLFTTLFDTATPVAGQAPRRWAPPLDIVENDGEYVLRADLPGVAADDVKIEVLDRVLKITGERKAAHEDQKDGFTRIERSYGSFARTLTLPAGIDRESIKANFDKGVLEIQVPKPEAATAHTVEIASSES
jgi:HSP20 family protein